MLPSHLDPRVASPEETLLPLALGFSVGRHRAGASGPGLPAGILGVARWVARFAAFAVLASSLSFGAVAWVHLADEVKMPGRVDGNSPSFWHSGQLNLLTTIGWPQFINQASDQFGPWVTTEVDRTTLSDRPTWFEAVWCDDDGTVFAWYHHEPGDLIPDSLLTAPMIGAAVSTDGGLTFRDLGIVLQSGDPHDYNAKNGFFVGGHGDFSVVLDRERKYFYFFFSNYGGAPASQGVAVARLAFADRFEPAGKVMKYYEGAWDEPGVGGRLTPIFPVRKAWNRADPDAFWGPAVHWNYFLNRHVMLLNRASGEPGWTQEGIYVSFCKDLSRPESWREPQQIMDRSWDHLGAHSYYPQVMGTGPADTDKEAGRTARLYVHGLSLWEIEFSTIDEREVEPTPSPEGIERKPPR